MPMIPIVDSAQAVTGPFTVWLCDIWGVLHNGVTAYPEASEALCSFRRSGGTVVLITNAPRPHGSVARQIAGLGVPAEAYDAIVTSGDVTRRLIEAEANAGHSVYHLGPQRDLPLFEGLGVHLVGPEVANSVVCTGLFNDETEGPDDYRDALAAMRAKSLPMICANPDIVVERGASISYCAGALGAAYEAIGGKVAYAGKPKTPIYEAALAAAGSPDKGKVLAIGDGLKTDILGAHDFGIASLFVASAIHLDTEAGLTPETLAKLFTGQGPRPIAAIERLKW